MSYLINSLSTIQAQANNDMDTYSQTNTLLPNAQPNASTNKSVSFQEPLTEYSRTQSSNREEMYNREFEERKRQYDSLLEKKVPSEVQFSEKEDSVILNMDELLQQQRKLRELDIPPPQPIQQEQKPSIQSEEEKKQKPSIQTEQKQNKYNPEAPVLTIHHDQDETRNLDPILIIDNNDVSELKKEFEEFKHIVLEFIRKFSTETNEPTSSTTSSPSPSPSPSEIKEPNQESLLETNMKNKIDSIEY